MQKAINILFTVAFTVSCLGLWLLLVFYESIYPLHLVKYLPIHTKFLLGYKFLFLVIPIPFLLFSTFAALRGQPTTEFNLLYVGIMVVIISFLSLLVIPALLFPWIPHIE